MSRSFVFSSYKFFLGNNSNSFKDPKYFLKKFLESDYLKKNQRIFRENFEIPIKVKEKEFLVDTSQILYFFLLKNL